MRSSTWLIIKNPCDNHKKYADNVFVKLCDVIEEFLLYLSAVRGLSENSVIAYKNDLEQFKTFLGPEKEVGTITREDFNFCIAKLSKLGRASTSINRFIAAVRTLFAYCRKFDYILTNPALDLKTVRTAKKVPDFMTEKEVDELCRQPETNELLWETRDRAIFEMLYSSGCRISEITNLKLSDFIEGTHAAIIKGKGNKSRKIFFEEEAQRTLSAYLEDRKKVLENNQCDERTDAVFINQKGHPISVGGMRFIINKYSGAQGTNRHVNPHAFRHTFATQLLANGADVRAVQELLGHSSISTTQRYTHITTEQLIETYNKAHPHSKDDK